MSLSEFSIKLLLKETPFPTLNILKKQNPFFIPGESRLVIRKYKFPFQFLLPSQLPSSFEGEFGFIRYMVTVLIEIPFEPIKVLEEQVTIFRMITLNDADLQVSE